MHFLVVGLLVKGWKRNLVALADGAVYIYNTAQDYGNIPEVTLQMSGCEGMCTYADDKFPNKPGVPPNSSAENGFVLRFAGKLHYFIADTVKEAK